MKETVRKRSDRFLRYTLYDLRIDLLSGISWSSYNYLRKYRFNCGYGGDITVPYYSDYPIKKNNELSYMRHNQTYNSIVIGQKV